MGLLQTQRKLPQMAVSVPGQCCCATCIVIQMTLPSQPCTHMRPFAVQPGSWLLAGVNPFLCAVKLYLICAPCGAQARHQFELAAREEGHAQAAAFAWLGNWEMEIARNGEAARELYNVALDLDPAEPAAGAPAGPNPSTSIEPDPNPKSALI